MGIICFVQEGKCNLFYLNTNINLEVDLMIKNSFETLLEEYCTLVAENRSLKEEIDRLKAMLLATNHPYDGDNLLSLGSFVLNSIDNMQQSVLI